MSTPPPHQWVVAQSNTLYLAVLCGSWICAGVTGWWLSVPIPISNSADVLPMFVYGMIASVLMSFIWLQLTGFESWQVAVLRGSGIIASSIPIFLLATTRGATNFIEILQNWRAVTIDNLESSQQFSTNQWWFLAFVQCLVCVSLWMCTLPLWKLLRWYREHPLARQSWMPNLVMGCLGLLIVRTIQALLDYQYQYPFFGPTVVNELAESSRNAAVFSLLFPAPLLLLKSRNLWNLAAFFALIIALPLCAWFADSFLRLGVLRSYHIRDSFQMLIGGLSFQFMLGIAFSIWRIRMLAHESVETLLESNSTSKTDSEIRFQTFPHKRKQNIILVLTAWILFALGVALLPVFLEPVTLFQEGHPAASWKDARRHARVLYSCKKCGTIQRVELAMNEDLLRREFPDWKFSDEERSWRLIVSKQAAMNESLLAELEQISTTGIHIILAVDVDPETLELAEQERLRKLGFRLPRDAKAEILKEVLMDRPRFRDK